MWGRYGLLLKTSNGLMFGAEPPKPLGLIRLIFLVLAMTPFSAVANEDGAAIAISANRGALSGQKAKSTSNPVRQLGLVGGRLDGTRTVRMDGRNLNGSSFALRFSGGSAEDSAAYETKNLLAPEKERRTRRSAVWFAGDVTLDSKRAEDPRLATVYTDGVVFGADTRLGRSLLVGNAVGMAFDKTGIGSQGSLETRALSDTLYASLATSPDTYLDVMLGASRTEFLNDLGVAALSSSERFADQAFGMARFSRQFQHNQLRLRPYGQARYLRTQLSAYDVKGDETYSVDAFAAGSLQFTMGLRGETSRKTKTGKVAPKVVLEISRALKRNSGSVVTSTDGIEEVAAASSHRSGRVLARTGIDWTITDAASVSGEYSVSTPLRDFEAEQHLSASFKLTF